jgi:hypothetical protein
MLAWATGRPNGLEDHQLPVGQQEVNLPPYETNESDAPTE